MKPELLIPFKKSREDAIAAYRQYYSGRPLLSRAFLKESHIEEMQAGYIPYYLYSGSAHVAVDYEAQDTKEQDGPGKIKKQIKNFEVLSEADVEYYRLKVNTSGQIPEDFMKNIEPFHFDGLIPADQAPDRDGLKELLDLDIEENDAYMKERIVEAVKSPLRDKIRHAYKKELDSDIDFHNEKRECVLFPIYLLNTRRGRTVYHFAMNGQTGKVYGDLPADNLRFMFYFMIPFLGIAGAVWAFLKLFWFAVGKDSSGQTNMIMLFIGLVVGMTIANRLMQRLYARMRKPRSGTGESGRYETLHVRVSSQKERPVSRQLVNGTNTCIKEDTYGSQDYSLKKMKNYKG
ncbi:MAG: hypothetical protein U0L49_00715 [Eubacterium sp.]|nr:hypothetical protein [Eubacterium sp.]